MADTHHVPEAVLDKHRSINTDDDWWECTIEQFVEDMKQKGIDTDAKQVSFRGFWSQGDGASFTGSLNLTRFFAAHPDLLESFPHHKRMLDLGGYDDFSIEVGRNSSVYYHEHTMSLTIMYGVDLDTCFDRDTALGEWAFQDLDKGLDAEILEFEEAVLDLMRDYARELYRSLREEYEGLTSDEAVAEAIEANELWSPDEDEETA